MSSIQFGKPLAAPSTQTILPAITSKGMLMGFYSIGSHTFNGNETTFALPDASVPVTTVTLPDRVQNGQGQGNGQGRGTGNRVQQYMAAHWPENQEGLQPWRGSASWVSPNDTGYYSWWSLPTESIMKHFGRGVLVDSLIQRMNLVPTVPGTDTAPSASNSAMRWAVSVNNVTLDTQCPFIDFNWVKQFQATIEADPAQQGAAVLPMRIDTVSNPTGNAFKATIVQTLSGAQAQAGGSVIYNTVRILKLAEDVAAGAYVFTFNISFVKDGVTLTTPVTLTLTVV